MIFFADRRMENDLDGAAINAIKNTAPFPQPPEFIFKTPATFQIAILFELV